MGNNILIIEENKNVNILKVLWKDIIKVNFCGQLFKKWEIEGVNEK